MKKLAFAACLLVTLVALMSWATRANAQSTYYTNQCAGCHGATPTTCNGCHAHGTHPGSAKSTINVAGSTDKTSYAPGEMVTVTITGGYRSGWIRAILYDQNMNELARSTGPSGTGGGPGYPITLTAPAPSATGSYSWNVSWYGNAYDASGAFFQTACSAAVTTNCWRPDPNNNSPVHGEEIRSITAFAVAAANPCADAATRCNDNSACTTDSCNSATGACINTAITCNDGLACTADTCNPASGCVYTPVVCSAGQTCNPATGGCVPVDLCAGKVCNDNNACTTDTCDPLTGNCVFTAIVCNDSNRCTTDTCNTAAGCVFTQITCTDSNPCTTDSCNPATGCVFTPVACSAGQTCDPTTGACVPINLCAGKVCNDNNACTTDSCDPATGNCAFTAKTCNDNNACTTDSCDPATGNCIFTAKVCNDANPCTTDSCNPATGNCVFAAITCNDNNACTIDSCDPATGCVYTPVTCSAGQTCDPATGSCVAADLCAGVSCNDNDACTTDTCDPATGSCIYTTKVCDDANLCTTDSCDPVTGTCVFAAITCNDNNACTIDTCDPATGCVYTPVTCSAGQACDPATGACVSNGLCIGVVCNDDNACTTDTCDPATGNCVFTATICDDRDACTTDTCDPAIGCVFTPVACDDGDACTVDSCSAGACLNVLDCSLAGCSVDPRCTATGSDVGIVSFRAPSQTYACGDSVSLSVAAKNFGTQQATGTITLYKNDAAVMTWSDVTFGPSSIVSKSYRYNASRDGGKTIRWYATVVVVNDPNPSNNTSSVKTTTVARCGDDEKESDD